MITRLRGDRVISVACAAIACGSGLLAIFASQDGGFRPSALVKISNLDPLAPYARAADPHFKLVNEFQHYDGAYYYAIARDPFLRGRAHTLIDQPAYRYGHPLHGWLAGALSLGQPRLVPWALLFLSLFGLALAGWAVSRLAVQFDRTPWAGVVIAISPGLLYSATVDTTEALGAALLALTMLCWTSRRFWLAVPLIVMLCLDKEQFVTVPIGLAIWELIEAWRRNSWPQRIAVKTTAVVLGPLVLTGWYLYVHARLHTWPWDYEPGNFGKPVSGWLETFRLAHVLAVGNFDQTQIGNLTPVVLVAIAVLLIAGLVVALSARTALDVPLIGMVIITSMQGWRTLLYPHEVFRTTAVATLLALGVLFLRPRQSRRTTDAANSPG